MQESTPKTHTYAYLATAAIISILVHLLLLGFAEKIPVRIFAATENEPEPSPYKRPVIRIFDVPELPPETADTDDSGEGSADNLPGDQLVRKYFEDTNLVVPLKPTLELSGLGSNIVLPSAAPVQATIPTAPRPEILAMQDDGLSPDELQRRFEIPDLPRTVSSAPTLPSLLADGPLSGGSLPPLHAGMRLSTPASSSLEDITLPPLPPPPPPAEEKLPPPSSLMPELPKMENQQDYQPMDALLTVKLHKYLPASGDGYFRIDVSPNPNSSHMIPIPKDVLILIDCSTSISHGKLKVFKEAAEFALGFLNSRDRFNVVSFRTRPEPLFDGYRPVTPTTITTAKNYVRAMARGGMTDVYAGLAPFVSQSRANTNPLLVYILTDGKSTVKNSLKDDEFLRKIAQVNRADVTIYSASAGKGANRFLLDLLSYSNRGLPLHREKYKGYDKILAQFMGMHNDIIVADLKYDLTGTLENQIYPRRLPHLYRGDTLSIYGRYPRKLKYIGLRLTGKSAEGKMQELIYQGDLSKAIRESSALSYDWIGQKVFDLVIKNVLSPKPEYAQEIRRLKQKYDLQIPYF